MTIRELLVVNDWRAVLRRKYDWRAVLHKGSQGAQSYKFGLRALRWVLSQVRRMAAHGQGQGANSQSRQEVNR